MNNTYQITIKTHDYTVARFVKILDICGSKSFISKLEYTDEYILIFVLNESEIQVLKEYDWIESIEPYNTVLVGLQLH